MYVYIFFSVVYAWDIYNYDSCVLLLLQLKSEPAELHAVSDKGTLLHLLLCRVHLSSTQHYSTCYAILPAKSIPFTYLRISNTHVHVLLTFRMLLKMCNGLGYSSISLMAYQAT